MQANLNASLSARKKDLKGRLMKICHWDAGGSFLEAEGCMGVMEVKGSVNRM